MHCVREVFINEYVEIAKGVLMRLIISAFAALLSDALFASEQNVSFQRCFSERHLWGFNSWAENLGF
jgi:hypothetical protein